jgi:hypothetical protein
MIAQADVSDPARSHGRDVTSTSVDGAQGGRGKEVPGKGNSRRSYRCIEESVCAVLVDIVRLDALVVVFRSKGLDERGQST